MNDRMHTYDYVRHTLKDTAAAEQLAKPGQYPLQPARLHGCRA